MKFLSVVILIFCICIIIKCDERCQNIDTPICSSDQELVIEKYNNGCTYPRCIKGYEICQNIDTLVYVLANWGRVYDGTLKIYSFLTL
ncbi:hypothetical protein PPL_11283 [Heterostelium album PN500]|uniref:Uncharacterized protein n=1 Tax=Heterostelium pallidum (strain ATCC 26659 / Pp 5 / PN500) TaxID=670386 RepID=D3BU23_HETP5|nr:hypothetical protein PPL_11283 [Heterostelium album PN500]EFA75209.1 hypothetical protein PPL_11283 [Heterostelium album PN500]|eukprot:XP_020427343.1 hypothetical protein PPL_11283 [Heterostelium album PN500]